MPRAAFDAAECTGCSHRLLTGLCWGLRGKCSGTAIPLWPTKQRSSPNPPTSPPPPQHTTASCQAPPPPPPRAFPIDPNDLDQHAGHTKDAAGSARRAQRRPMQFLGTPLHPPEGATLWRLRQSPVHSGVSEAAPRKPLAPPVASAAHSVGPVAAPGVRPALPTALPGAPGDATDATEWSGRAA